MSLEKLLVEGLKPRPKKKAPAVDEARLYGGPLSEEITTLLSANERYPLDRQSWGDLRPLFFEEPFGLGGKDAAKAHLERAPELGWPVYFEAHFWNAFPIGATGGGDYLLAQIEAPKGVRGGVFRYDHETGELSREANSIAALVAAARGLDAPAARASGKVDARFDPISLYQRSYWLTSWLRGANPGAEAPSVASFDEEKPLVASVPHLALYWLFAHAILGNRGALEETIALTAKSKHAFVSSARVLCKKLVDEPTFGVGAFTSQKRAQLFEMLHPPDEQRDLLRPLEAVAEREGGDFARAVAIVAKFARFGGSPGGSKWPENWVDLLADPRLRDVLLHAFRQGQELPWTDPKCSDWFIEPLGRLGDPVVTEAFVDAITKRCHRNRRVKLVGQLRSVRDPRVDKAFDDLLVFLEQEKYAADPDPLLEGQLRGYVEASAARYLALGDRSRLERLVVAVLAGPSKIGRANKHHAAALAVDGKMTRAVPALEKALLPWASEARPPYACQEDFVTLGAALAQLSPEDAARVFVPVWQKFLTYGPLETYQTNENLFAIGTAVLVPLLGSTARAEYFPIAEKMLDWVKAHPVDDLGEGWQRGVGHLHTGLRLARGGSRT